MGSALSYWIIEDSYTANQVFISNITWKSSILVLIKLLEYLKLHVPGNISVFINIYYLLCAGKSDE